MIRCGIVEDNEAMLASFMGGLNKEIHACKAEHEVQDRQALA